MPAATIIAEDAIRTGDWRIPGRPRRPRRIAGLIRFTPDPRSFYLVLDPDGERLGYISHSEKRPALKPGGPTYYLKRSCSSPAPFLEAAG